jgi:hypothetical protein
MRLRRVWAGFCLAVIVVAGGCGGGEMSLTEYVERLNAIVDGASQQYEVLVASPQGAVLVAEGAQLTDFTPQDLQAAFVRLKEIEMEVQEATEAIEPPEQIADLHNFFFDFDDDSFISAQDALAARAGTAADWQELSESPEMAAYRAALAADKETCTDIEAELNATAERGVFADVPWIPGELKEIVEVVLGCAGYPEHPEDVYRPPPTSTP